jgi:hypothetical protein
MGGFGSGRYCRSGKGIRIKGTLPFKLYIPHGPAR